MTTIHAPWTDEQVERLNQYQQAGRFHPYTCPGRDDDADDDADDCPDRNLIATTDGWVCQCGAYRQTWAHGFTAAPPTMPKTLEDLLRTSQTGDQS